MKRLTMAVGSGLGDRVRASLWGFRTARELGMEFELVWEQDPTCQVWFDDLFTTPPMGHKVHRETTLHKHYLGWASHQEALDYIHGIGDSINGQCMVIVAPHFPYEEMDQLFVPQPEIFDKAKAFSEANHLNRRVGMHVRADDPAGSVYKAYAPKIEAYIAAFKRLKRYGPEGICLATCDIAHCGGLLQMGSRINVVQYPVRAVDFSKEAILDAAVVLYSMRDTAAFVGSRYSGFTSMITKGARCDDRDKKIGLWKKEAGKFALVR